MSADFGDDSLATRARTLLGRQHPVAAVTTVSSQRTVLAGWGADEESDFEIGSISKGVTGLLYRDAAERGVVRADTRLGDLLPLEKGCPAADIELEALSKHRSGLPSVPPVRSPFRRTWRMWRNGASPYGESLGELVAQAATVEVGPPRPSYSTFGFELLGHALAAAAGTTYPELVTERIAAPLGLKSWFLPTDPSQLRATSLTGRSRWGRPRAPWTGQALAPAGGIRSTIGDMADLTRSLLEERVAGLSALDPVARFAGEHVRIGAAWITSERKGRAITWHNGATGGFRSWIGLDRESGTGVVILSATSAPVDRQGFGLLHAV